MQKNKPQTLVILTPGFPENEADSTCIPPQQVFVRVLQEINPQINVVVFTFIYPFFSKKYTWNGINVTSFGHPKNGRLSRLLTARRVNAELQRLQKENNIIGLLSFWLGKSAVVGTRFAQRNNLKHFIWLLGQDAKPGNKYFYKIKPQRQSLIAISNFVANKLNENYGVVPQQIIPVGIDTGLFSGDCTKDIDILGAGSLIPLKKYAVFVEVVGLVKQHLPSIKTVICGDGPEMNKLKDMIASMNLQDNILLVGRKEHGEVLALMERSKILLHPSNYEGFSTVCLEALYARAKVVSFIKPMTGDIENWHIAENKEGMVTVLLAILQDSQVAYKRISPYTVQESASAITGLFK